MKTPGPAFPRRLVPILIIFYFLSTMLFTAIPQSLAEGHRSDGAPERVPVNLNFDAGAMGDLVPSSVAKDPVEQVQALGNPITPYLVGRWTTNQVKFPLSVYGPFSCTLWAESQKGAKNAYFVVEITKGGAQVATINTSRQAIGTNPTRFELADTLNIELDTGETLTVTVNFYADLNVVAGTIFPQPAQITFLYGGAQYASKISITTLPIVIEIPRPEFDGSSEVISFSATVKEAFDTDPAKMNYSLTITPPVDCNMKTLSEVDTHETDEGTIFSVDWDYLKDKGKDGDYKITMAVSYDGNFSFTNSSKIYIEVPHKSVTNLNETPKQPLIIGSAGIGVLLVGLTVYFNRRTLFKKRYASTKSKASGKPRQAVPKQKISAKTGGNAQEPSEVEEET